MDRLTPGSSHGTVLKRLELAGFLMSEISHSAHSRIADHAHENAHFCFVLDGAYTETHRRKELVCEPHTATFRLAGEPHADRFYDRDVRVFIVEVAGSWMERLGDAGLKLNDNSQFRAGLLPQLISRLNREFHRTDMAAALAIEGLGMEVIAETSRHSFKTAASDIPLWLARAYEMIRSRALENLTLEQIANEVGVHPVHLAATFRRKYGCTVGELVRQLRIEFACREIAKGKTSLSQIALETGFANQSHFTRTFKRLTGTTPLRYKNSLKS